jgi:YebC/PmpR family DNA-binding regulatory protein
MSGHSKWSQIKHKKSATDAKKSQMFSKLSKEITVAVKEKGPNIDMNPKLKAVVEKAKKFNLPNDNIERIIKKSSGQDDGQKFEELLIEAYGPYGTAIIIKAITDNRNRTISELRHLLSKHEGKLAGEGSVMWLFKPAGKITVDLTGKNKDDVELAAIESGAEDVATGDNKTTVYTKPDELYLIKESLKTACFEAEEASFDFLPLNPVNLAKPEEIKKVEELFDILDENEDVQEIYSNCEFSE